MGSFWSGVGGGVASAAGSIVGDVLSFKSARDANKMNREQTEANRAWEEKMSNTAHQREVEDLRAAGLNPILSVNSGASTPNVNPIPMQPTIKSNAGASALTALLNKELVQTEKTKQALNESATAKQTAEGDIAQADADFYNTPYGRFINGAQKTLGVLGNTVGIGVGGVGLYRNLMGFNNSKEFSNVQHSPLLSVPVKRKK